MLILGQIAPFIATAEITAPDDSIVATFEGVCSSTQTLTRIDSDPLNFAQFANAIGGFSSDIVITNPSSVMASGSVSFSDGSGDPMPVSIVGEEAAVSSVDFLVEPHGSVVISTDPGGEGGAGSATASADGPVAGFVRFDFPGAGIAGVSSSGAYDGFLTPVRLVAGGVNTGIAVQNPGAADVTLTLRLKTQAGEEVATLTEETLAAGGHWARFIDELFSDYLAGVEDFVGTLVVEVDGGHVTGTALELDLDAGAFTTLPVSQLQ